MRASRRPARVLSPIALVLVLSTPADSALLCRKRSGALVLRQTCAKRELPVDLAALGAVGPQGPAGAAALVKDVTGQLVGSWSLNPTFGPPGVVRSLGGRVVFLQTDASGFRSAGLLYYEAADCAGTPLVPSVVDAVVVTATVAGTMAYLPSGTTSPRSLYSYVQTLSATECSLAGGAHVPPDRCCFGSGTVITADVAPAETVDLTTLGLVPPFHAEMP